jgi:hypothetical protein
MIQTKCLVQQERLGHFFGVTSDRRSASVCSGRARVTPGESAKAGSVFSDHPQLIDAECGPDYPLSGFFGPSVSDLHGPRENEEA